jgi:hypothetical protein
VLERFGDPAAVARKLWLDWMWERIMNQRILVATCVIMVAISCVALGLAWASLKGQQEMMATWQSTSETQMRDQQKLFERLLAQSEKALTQRGAGSSESIEWNPVELKFVAGSKDGAPVPGVSARMWSSAEGSNIPELSGESDQSGIVRFERVHFGSYRVQATTPAQEYVYTSLIQQPGKSLSRTIVCPRPAAEQVRVEAQVDWPEDFEDRSLWFRFHASDVFRMVGDQRWYGPSIDPSDKHYRSILCQPDGRVYGRTSAIEARPEDYLIGAGRGGRGRGTRGSRGGLQQSPLPLVRWNQLADERAEVSLEGMMWPGRDFKIGKLEVLIPMPDIRTMEELRSQAPEDARSAFRSAMGRLFERQQFFFALQLASTEWSHHVEPGEQGKPGMLRLTPTDEAVEKLRAALAEIEKAREAAEKARIELENARALEAQQQSTAVATDAKKTDSKDSK